MNKKTLLVLLVALFATVGASAQKGDMSVGLNLGYGSEIESAALGVKFNYGLMDQIQLSPSFNYFFENDGISGWEINANAHYLFNIAPQVNVYPLAGLVLTSWSADFKYHNPYFGTVSIDHSETKFGLNLGGGINFRITPQFSAGVEVKYTIVSDLDQFVPMAHVMYHF